MDLKPIEAAVAKLVESLDKGIRLETVLEEDDEYRVILSKGNHSDRATLTRDLLEGFIKEGKRAGEVKKAVGKVISKLNLAVQRGR